MFSKFKHWKFSKNRTEAFSDGVFAVAITLLVLEVKVPHLEHGISSSNQALVDALRELFPKILSWVVSFFLIAVMWVQHHNLLRMADTIDYGIVWLNNIFLFSIGFLPFTTALMGEYPNNQLGVLMFGINSTIASLMLVLLYYSIAKNHLNSSYEKASVMKNVKKSFLLAPLPLLLAIGLSFISLWIPYLIYGIVPFFFLLPMDRERS